MKLSLLVQRWRCEDARLVANVPELSGEKTIWGLCADELEAALAQQIEMTQQPWTCACGKYGLDEGLIATPGDERHSAAECAVRPTQQAQEPMMPIREHEAVAQAMTVLLAEVDALRAGQAQPLTDDDNAYDILFDALRFQKRYREFVSERADQFNVYLADDLDETYLRPALAAAARDRMAQQAQPECKHGSTIPHEWMENAWAGPHHMTCEGPQPEPLTDEAMEAKARAVFIDPNDCRAALMFGRWVRTQCVAAAESLDVVALRERIAALRNNGRSSRETREWNRCLDTVLKELEAKA